MMLGKVYRRIWHLIFVRTYVGSRWPTDEEIKRERSLLKLVGHR